MENLLQNKEIIIFDFDGVLNDSVSIKSDAFRYVFRDFDKDLVEKFIQYHEDNGGVHREEKLKYFYENILNKELKEDVLNKHRDDFTTYIIEHSFDKGNMIDDSVNFVKKIYKTKECYVASAALESELLKICDFFEITQYFKGICGGPLSKSKVIANIVKGKDKSKAVMIGDGKKDYEFSTVENGIDFIGYNNVKLKGLGIGYIESFSNIKL